MKLIYNKQHVLMHDSVFQLINHDMAEILPIRRKTLNIILWPSVLLFEFLQLRNITCPNLTKFLGLTENNSTVYCVSELCPRGDLRVWSTRDSKTTV